MALIVAWHSDEHHDDGEWTTLDKPLSAYDFADLIGECDDEPTSEGDPVVEGKVRLDDGRESTFKVMRSYSIDYRTVLDEPEAEVFP